MYLGAKHVFVSMYALYVYSGLHGIFTTFTVSGEGVDRLGYMHWKGREGKENGRLKGKRQGEEGSSGNSFALCHRVGWRGCRLKSAF